MPRSVGSHFIKIRDTFIGGGQAQAANIVKADILTQFIGQDVDGFPGLPGHRCPGRIPRDLQYHSRRPARSRAAQGIALQQQDRASALSH